MYLSPSRKDAAFSWIDYKAEIRTITQKQQMNFPDFTPNQRFTLPELRYQRSHGKKCVVIKSKALTSSHILCTISTRFMYWIFINMKYYILKIIGMQHNIHVRDGNRIRQLIIALDV